MAWLKHLPSIEKIKRVVWDCDGSKTLGPNGFTFSFYKKTWSLLSSDIFAIVNSFFRYEKLFKGIRSSFVVSIPKKRSPIYFLEFRPTSLINELWQNCCLSILKYVFISVISVSQTGFTAWRHILDGFMIVNEVVSIKLRTKGIMFFLFKEDFHKAFDSVLWNYLNDVIVHMGFGILWRSLIKECLSSSKMAFIHYPYISLI